MPNLPISQLPLALSGQPESLMVIVNYDVIPSGETNSIYFSALTQQFSGDSGSPAVIILGDGNNSSVRCGVGNTASGNYSAVLGGSGNTTNARMSFIGGGNRNVIQSPTNECCSLAATIGGGSFNTSSGYVSFVGGGYCNTSNGQGSVVVGGCCNSSTGNDSFVGGGFGNTASGATSFIGGGFRNISSGEISFIGGGYCNTASGDVSFVGGGYCNTANSGGSVVGGGYRNISSGYNSFVGAGFCNIASGSTSFIGGGQYNNATECFSTIGGGCFNTASGYVSFIGGGQNNRICSGSTHSTIGGGCVNTICSNSSYSTIGGGCYNDICNNSNKSTISGGYYNKIKDGSSISTIGGGRYNYIISASDATIGGGYGNVIRSSNSTIGGGYCNTISSGFTHSNIIGSNVTANRACTTFVNDLSVCSFNSSSGCSVCVGSDGLLVVAPAITNGTSGTSGSSGSSGISALWNFLGVYQVQIHNIGDVVTFDGQTWYCIQYAPSGAGPFGGYIDVYWTLIAASGTNGSSGTSGESGSSGTSGSSPVLPPSISYGLFAQTGDSTTVSATTVETSVIGPGVGTLSVPANSFSVGDSFLASFDGVLSCINTATIHIHIRTTGGVLLIDTGVIDLDTSTSRPWLLNLYFTIRQIGGATVASISSGGLFSYLKDSGLTYEGYPLSEINNTTFDTTIINTIEVNVQWNTNNAGNQIFSRNFTLTKIY